MARLSTETRREQIADAVLEIIATDGIDRLSMPLLAKKLDVVPSALYRHFKNKEEMIAAGIESLHRRIDSVISDVSPSDDVLAPFRRMLSLHREILPIATIFPRIAFSLGSGNGGRSRRRKLRGLLDSVFGKLESYLREGQAKDIIRKDIDPETMVLNFWGILLSATIRWYITDSEFDVKSYHRKAWRLFRNAVMVEHGSGKGPAKKPPNRGGKGK